MIKVLHVVRCSSVHYGFKLTKFPYTPAIIYKNKDNVPCKSAEYHFKFIIFWTSLFTTG